MVCVRGVEVYKGALDIAMQERMVDDIRQVALAAPMFSPVTRGGRRMSVRITSAGRYGWYADRNGYRYERRHPGGRPWPDIPESIASIWARYGSAVRPPDCCLINFYDANAKLGMHQDRDERDFAWPVVSISLGDEALFRVGNVERRGATRSIWLVSGDVAVLAGDSRLCHHGIDRIRFGSSKLLANGGRLNVTLRVVD